MSDIESGSFSSNDKPEKGFYTNVPITRDDDPQTVLRAFFRSFYCSSAGEVLFKSKKMESKEYIELVAVHPALQRLKELLPESELKENVEAYCEKELVVLNKQDEIVEKSTDLRWKKRKAQDLIDKSEIDKKPKISADTFSGKPAMFALFVFGLLFYVFSRFMSGWVMLILGLIFFAGFVYVFTAEGRAPEREREREEKKREIIGQDLCSAIDNLELEIDAGWHEIYEIQLAQGEILKKINEEEKEILSDYKTKVKKGIKEEQKRAKKENE
ncbi:MAG: US12 family protein [Clostridiales bacterium]|nr:US12 family protein [Clostridiales bacterium]